MNENTNNSGTTDFYRLLGRFRDSELERRFLDETRDVDLNHVIRALFVVSLVYIGFIPIDFLEQQSIAALITVCTARLGLFALAIGLIQLLKRSRRRADADVVVFVFVAGFCIASNIIFLHQTYMDPGTEGYMIAATTYLVATLVTYVVLPMRVAYQLVYTSCYAIGFYFVYLMIPPDEVFHISVVAGFFVAVNVLGLMLSSRIKELRHTQWLALEQARQRANDLDREIERREVLEDRLREQANTDPLTGIGNRRNFFELGTEIFSQAKRYGRPLSAILFDVDFFKHINDAHGHAAGDEVLKSVVGSISGVLRRPDVFCRYGGEEFAILMPESDAVGASRLAERIRSVVEQRTIRVDKHEEHVTISVGVAVCGDGDEEFGDLITRADDALYSAKNKGRNMVVVAV